MATLKVVLRNNYQKKDGSFPLAIRITQDRKTRYVFTGKYVQLKDWNAEAGKVKKSHPNSIRLNNLLLKKLVEANDTSLEIEALNHRVSAKEIKRKIKRTGKTVSFFQLAHERIERYKKKGTFSVSNAEQSIVNNLKKFIKDKELYFEDITQPFLECFKVFCSSTLNQKTRTVTNQLIFIRTMFNIALKEGVAELKHYPFSGDKEKIRIGSGLKVGLTKEEVECIENLALEWICNKKVDI